MRSPFGTSVAACLWACALGCEGATPTGADDEGASGAATSSTGGTAGTTYDGPRACAGSDECDGGYCVAPYDAGAANPADGMGEASCVDACVPEAALERWCIDDAACCAGLECDAIDGFCVAPAASTSTIGDTWTTSGDGSSSGGSSSDGGTSDGGGSDGSGSDGSTGTG